LAKRSEGRFSNVYVNSILRPLICCEWLIAGPSSEVEGMMIEDSEMRELFRIESGEHLQRLDEGLLLLEKDPKNRTVLEEVLREAHSLKGAAHMIGLSDIETVSHRFEDILGGPNRNKIVLPPELIDGMYRSLDAIRKLAEEAITGVPSGVIVSDVLSWLQSNAGCGVRNAETEQSKIQNQKSKIEDSELRIPNAEGATGNAELKKDEKQSEIQNPQSEFRIETIRVDTRKLDVLMTHAGELTVAKLRIARLLTDIEEMIEQWGQLHSGIAGYCLRSSDLKSKVEQFSGFLERLKSSVYDNSSRLEYVAGELEDGVRAIRLLPLSTIFNLFPPMVRNLSRERSREAQLIIEGGETTADKRIIEEMKDPLMHIIRNAVDHGIEPPEERERNGKPRTGTIILRSYQTASNIVIEVKDDGRGLDIEAIRRSARKQKLWREDELDAMSPEQIQSLIFVSGLSTSSFVSDVSGRGVGLDVVRANVEHLKGNVTVDSMPGAGCTIQVKLLTTLATARVLIIMAGGVKYALPVEYVLRSYPVRKSELFTIEGREAIVFEDKALSVERLSDLLHIRRTDFVMKNGRAEPDVTHRGDEMVPCIIVAVGEEKLGLLIDELLDEQEIVLKPQSVLLKHVRDISGTTILGTGEVCMVLNPHDLIKSVRKQVVQTAEETKAEPTERKKTILMAEDSLTTRTQIKRILEGAGYEVVAAVDGIDAFSKLGTRPFDALVSDILMPNMDGLTLTAKVRQDKKYKELPIILVTSLASEDDRRKGLEAGANAYITKPAFDQEVLIDTLRRFV
jgi:two-component system chemotaxis sensor kinase CheA